MKYQSKNTGRSGSVSLKYQSKNTGRSGSVRLKYQSKNTGRSGSVSLKYQRFIPSDCWDLRIREFMFVAKTHFSFVYST